MKLVDAHAVCDLLSDNIDENVSHFIIFTDHGTLLAHDRSLLPSSLTKFAPFAGTTWRTLSSTHRTPTAVPSSDSRNGEQHAAPFPEMKVLRIRGTAHEEGEESALAQITVEMDDTASVIRQILPRLLLAAQTDLGKKGSDTAKLEAMPSPDAINNTDDEEKEDDNDERSSRLRVLELKAEAMAEFLAGEYPEKLPGDFY